MDQYTKDFYVNSLLNLINKSNKTIFNPFSIFRQWPTRQEAEEILDELRKKGFIIENPIDPNKKEEGFSYIAYYTIRW